MKRPVIMIGLGLFLVLGILVGMMLINPWILTRPSADMYGNSIARAYLGGDGKCEKGQGDWWDCAIEIDPGSGFGASLVMWTEGRNCWTAYFNSPSEPRRPFNPGDREAPPGTNLRGKPLTGCVSLRKDGIYPWISPLDW